MSARNQNLIFPQDLGDGLVLYRATRADANRVAGFITEQLNEGLGINLRDLMTKDHPTANPGDVVFVTDSTAGDRIVSAVGMIPHTWRYADVPFGVGNPEFIATDPDYQRRGLFSAMMRAVHAISEQSGHLAQAVVGVPWLYRRVGYEYALDADHHRDLYLRDVPVLTDGAEEPYRIRPAQVDDIPALMALYERQCTGKLVTNVLSEARWRYDLTQHSDGSDIRMHVMILVDGTDVVIGYYKTWWDAWGSFRLQEFGLAAGHPYRVAGPTVMRYVANLRGGYEEEFTDEQPNRIRFSLGAEHSLYAAYDRTLTPLVNAGAWYLRVPDLPGLLRHVAPVLERRLAQSALSGYTGTLYLNGYVDGLELTFTRGMLAGVTPVDPRERDGQWFASSGDAHFPPGVFLKLLFGYRSLAELCYAYPDCRASDAAAALLEVLFPKQPSWVTFVG